MKEIENYYTELINQLKIEISRYDKNEPYYSQFKHLLIILGEKETNEWIGNVIDYLKYEDNLTVQTLYTSLHKSLRQNDVFSGENSGHLDMIMYELMNMNSNVYILFQKIFI